MNISKTTFIFLATIFIFSCRKENSEEINQSEIYTDYRIVYKEDLDRTFIRATFKHKVNTGENLKLGSDAIISIEDDAMIWNSTFWRYETNISGIRDVNINFQDNDGNVFKNSINFNQLAQYEKLTAGNDSLYKDSVQFIPWDNAGALVEGEKMHLLLIQNSTLVIVASDTIGATGLYLTNTTLSKLQLGSVDVHFEKWTDTSVDAPNAGGSGTSQTISTTQTVKIL